MVGGSNRKLYTLNAATGVATQVGSQSAGFGVGENSPTGLATIGNTLYMTGWGSDKLYTLDTTTGTATQVGSLAGGFGVGEGSPSGIAAIGNTLYMVGRGNQKLYTLNTTTGAATQVGTLGAGFGVNQPRPDGLAAIGSTLYMVGEYYDNLYTLNTTTGAATRVGSAYRFGANEYGPSGLAALGETLYMIGLDKDKLYTLDTTTGAATAVGSAVAFGVNEDTARGLGAITTTTYPVTLQTPSESPGNDTTPTIRVTSPESGLSVKLFDSSACTGTAVSSAVTVSDTTEPYTVDITADTLSEGTHTLRAQYTDAADNTFCGTQTVVYEVDTTVPTVSFAAYSGSTMTLELSEDVFVSGTKIGGDFTVAVAGASDPTVSSYAINGSTVSLTLNAAVASGATVTLAYTKNTTAANRITDAAGNELAAIASQSATDKSVSVAAVSTDDYISDTEDESAVTISGTSVSLTTGTTVTVEVDGSGTDITKTDTTDASGDWSVSLTSAEVKALDASAPDADGEELTVTASADSAVSGVRTVTYDPTAPTVSSMAVSGTTITVTMDEGVYAATTPDTGDFVITGGGAPSVSTIGGLPTTAGSADSSFTLTTATALTAGTPTLAYTQNSTDSKRIKDPAGNTLASASGVFISGVTPAPTAPTLALQSPASSPGNSPAPTIRVTVDSTQQNGTVQLYSDSGCSTALSIAVPVDAATEDVETFTLTEAEQSVHHLCEAYQQLKQRHLLHHLCFLHL